MRAGSRADQKGGEHLGFVEGGSVLVITVVAKGPFLIKRGC
jgi:hypothetical protein